MMQVTVQPDYVAMAQNAFPMVSKTTERYGGPMGLVGKVVGLGADEIRAGIPGWGWAGIGIVAGVCIGYVLRNQISLVVR